MHRLGQNVHNKSREPAGDTQRDLIDRLTSADENLRQEAVERACFVCRTPETMIKEKGDNVCPDPITGFLLCKDCDLLFKTYSFCSDALSNPSIRSRLHRILKQQEKFYDQR